ncbi:MAG: tRNA epoxyqueuosine(34) reductase QueG [Halothiobacillaceae bacterium]
MNDTLPPESLEIAHWIRQEARALGFTGVGITDTDLGEAEEGLQRWLAQGFHGEMEYMARHGLRRARPSELVPGTVSIISVRMDYLPPLAEVPRRVLADPRKGYVSRYALGRDYHKVLRQRLQKLAERLRARLHEAGHALVHRAFTDSAPVMETVIAEKAGLGWKGKHSLLLSREAGSWFFLGELFTNLPLPVDQPVQGHCGRCTACLDICPTRAIVADGVVDARRCISYLTIELDGPIPLEFRRPMGNRIYGCDDCQLVCPWNRFARHSEEADFRARHGLDDPELVALFGWTEAQFLERMAGSAIRRIGYRRWQRNLAVALGNAPPDERVVRALKARLPDADHLLREHIEWALAAQRGLC